MTENERLDLQIRLAAIEYCIALIGKSALTIAVGHENAGRQAELIRSIAAQHLRDAPLPSLSIDPAMSDHVADELHVQVDRILAGLVEMAGLPRSSS